MAGRFYFIRLLVCALIGAFAVHVAHANFASSTSYIIESGEMTEGLSSATSSNFTVINSMGQPALGISTSSNYKVLGGFLYFPVVLQIATSVATTTPASTPAAGPVPTGFLQEIIGKILPGLIKPPAPKCGGLIGDLNCDGRVDLVDVSIMLHWWDKQVNATDLANLSGLYGIENPDLDKDRLVDITDISILLHHWTG